MRRPFLTCAALFLAWLAIPQQARANETRPIIVFAAASLTDVLKAQAEAWAATANRPVPRLSFGASATMARQVAADAPADLMLSANPAWVTMLRNGKHLAGKPVPLVKNSLVLVAPKTASPPPPQTTVTRNLLLAAMGDGRLALADPAIAPAGTYARDFLQRLGIWESIKPRLALAPNVRQALALVERGGLPGFIYGSDAASSSHVTILGRVPEGGTKPILYMAGLVKGAHADASDFLTYLTSSAAATNWQKFGFVPIVSK